MHALVSSSESVGLLLTRRMACTSSMGSSRVVEVRQVEFRPATSRCTSGLSSSASVRSTSTTW